MQAPDAGTPLVVYPFNVHSDGNPEDLGAAVAELLVNGLDGAMGIRAVRANAPPTVSTAPKRSQQDWAQAATIRSDGGRSAPFVVGDIVQSVQRLRISAQLLATRMERGRGDVVRVASVTTASLDAAKAYFTAQREYRDGQFGAAGDAFSEALRIDPGFALASYGLSSVADMLGDRELALRSAQDALREAQRLPNRQRRLTAAYLARQREDTDEAVRLYSQLTIDDPSDAEGWRGLGETQFHHNPLRGRTSVEARDAFEEVARISPRDVGALVHLARIASLAGDPATARSVVARARTLASDEVLGRYALHVLALGGPGMEEGVGRDRLERAAARPPGPTAIELLSSRNMNALERFALQRAARGAAAALGDSRRSVTVARGRRGPRAATSCGVQLGTSVEVRRCRGRDPRATGFDRRPGPPSCPYSRRLATC